MRKSIVFLLIILPMFLAPTACKGDYKNVEINKEELSNPQVFEGQEKSDKSNSSEENELNTVQDSTDSNTPNLNYEEAYGGGNYRLELLAKHEFDFYTVKGSIISFVGQEKFEEWLSQFKSYNNPNGRDLWEVNLSNAVIELNYPKEAFIEANKGIVYTDEQIEAIYSGDLKLINRVFVNRNALLVDDEIYTADWLASRTAKDYEEAGISDEVLSDYLNKIDKLQFKDEYLSIKGSLKKAKKDKSYTTSVNDKKTSKMELEAPYRLEYYGIDSFIYEIVEAERLNDWMDQFTVDYYKNTRPMDECNIVNLVKELNISEEDFTGANSGLVYTKDQIKSIYSNDQKNINKAFVNEFALLVNDEIYTIDWLIKNKQEYEKIGITKEVVEDWVENINIPELEMEYGLIKSAFK